MEGPLVLTYTFTSGKPQCRDNPNRIKGRTCAIESTQREYIERDDAACPAATTDSELVPLMPSKEARKQGRDVMTADIYPNTFVQAVINDK